MTIQSTRRQARDAAIDEYLTLENVIRAVHLAAVDNEPPETWCLVDAVWDDWNLHQIEYEYERDEQLAAARAACPCRQCEQDWWTNYQVAISPEGQAVIRRLEALSRTASTASTATQGRNS